MRSYSAAQIQDQTLVERDHQIRSLHTAIESGKEGKGGLLLVEGPFGTGKTSLLKIAREYGAGEGMTVLGARASKFEAGFRYGVARQLLEQWLATASPEERADALSGRAAPAEPLFDYADGDLPGRNGDERDHAARQGLYHMLVNLSAHRPVLVALDDLHWADPPSLCFLRSIADRLGTHPIVCCATTDPTVSGRDAGVVRDLAAAATRVLTVGPLSRPGVSAYLARTLGGPVRPDVAAACHRATAGNPFFLHELAEELRGTPDSDALADPARVARLAPRTLGQAVLRWIQHAPERHGENALALGRALAVLGTSRGVDQLAEIAALTRAEASEAAGALAAIGIITPGPTLRYTAPVVRDAVYEQLPQTFRYSAHCLAAQVLDADGAPPEKVAEHLQLAPPREDSRDAGILIDAGRTALREGDFTLAVARFRRAMQQTLPDRTRATLLTGLGKAELSAGDPLAADHLRQAMDLTTDPVGRARIAIDLSRALNSAARYKEALTLLRTAHGETREHHDRLALRLHSEFIKIARVMPVAVTAPEGAFTDPDFPSAADWPYGGLAHQAFQALLNGETAEAVTRLCEDALKQRTAADVADSADQDPWLIAFCLASCGRFAEAGALLDDAVQDAEALGRTVPSGNLRGLRAFVNLKRGMLSEADTDATAVLDSAFGESPELGRPFAVFAFTELLVLRDQPTAATRALRRYGVNDASSAHLLPIPVTGARGLLRLSLGQTEPAVRDLLRIHEQLAEWGARCPALPPSPLAVYGLARLGRHIEARDLATRHLADARAFGAPHVIAAALCADARATQGAIPFEPLEEAVELLDGSPAVLARAAVLLQLGRALHGAGQYAQARRRLRAADEIADAAGAVRLSKRARRTLGAMGARVHEPVRHGASGLTPREHRVSALAAKGKRNQDIAHTLSVTVKTVEWHLSQVYRKLGIASRYELSEALAHA